MCGEQLDLTSDDGLPAANSANKPARNYLGIQFACCGVYARIYRHATEAAYVGHCPRCTRPVRVEIAPGGTNSRFFTVY